MSGWSNIWYPYWYLGFERWPPRPLSPLKRLDWDTWMLSPLSQGQWSYGLAMGANGGLPSVTCDERRKMKGRVQISSPGTHLQLWNEWIGYHAWKYFRCLQDLIWTLSHGSRFSASSQSTKPAPQPWHFNPIISIGPNLLESEGLNMCLFPSETAA